MKLDEIMKLDQKYYMNTFGARTPVCFEYGKGMYLWDIEGNKYCDFLAGIAVSALGHSHPKLVKALTDQVGKFLHCSSLYYIRQQAELAEMLVNISCADRVFFANSGAEANEGAIKLARLYFRKRGKPEKFEIITLDKSFHGRTLTTLAATGQEKYQNSYRPLTPRFKHVPINDLHALEETINEQTCAIMLEPVQGEGGINILSPEYIRGVRELCDKHGILMILDEVQTGLGRTGRMFCYEHFGVEPDIFTLAKALGGGVPIGAICAKGESAEVFSPGDHGSTFGGNPLACTAAITVLKTIEEENLLENSRNMGAYMMEKFTALQHKHNIIREVRGMGLMIGIQVDGEIAVTLKEKCFEKGYLVGNVGTGIIRLLPPLIVAPAHINDLVSALDTAFSEIRDSGLK